MYTLGAKYNKDVKVKKEKPGGFDAEKWVDGTTFMTKIMGTDCGVGCK